MKRILELISKYDQIMIYRHVNPDLDAFGSQFGVYYTLKSLFPNKSFILEGNMTSNLLKLYPKYKNNEIKEIKSLGIVLDTANQERIDGDITKCDQVIKIDHHIVVDSYGDLNIEKESASSCCEIVTLLFKEANIKLPIDAANALYLGIIGDSNRFLYSSTTTLTFEAASYLLEAGVNIQQLYERLYLKKKDELNVLKFIYNNYKEDSGVAWYYLSDDDLNTLGISREEGSNYVYTLANIEEYPIWLAVTQNKKDNNIRVSIRSRNIAVNEVANEFRGGGHAFASGATLLSLEELDLLINRLKEKIHGQII